MRMDEQLHGFSLFPNYVDYSCLKSGLVPQVDNTSLTGPLALPRSIKAAAVESPGGTGLDGSSHGNPCPGGADHSVHVSFSDMNGPGKPSVLQTGLEDGLEHTLPSWPAEGIGLDTHLTHHLGMQSLIWTPTGAAVLVVGSIYAAVWVAVQANPMTSEGQKIGKGE